MGKEDPADPLAHSSWPTSASIDIGKELGTRKDGSKCVSLIVIQFVQDTVGALESTFAAECLYHLGNIREFVSRQ